MSPFVKDKAIHDLEFIDHDGRSLYVEGAIDKYYLHGFEIISVHIMENDTSEPCLDYNVKEVEDTFRFKYFEEISAVKRNAGENVEET